MIKERITLDGSPESPTAMRPWQFSIRRLLGVTLLAAVLLGFGRLWPQPTIFLAVTLLAFYCFWVFRRALLRKNWRRAIPLGLATILAWSAFYVASVGPVTAMVERLQARPWSWESLETFYPPLVWCYSNDILRDEFVWYVSWWRDTIGGRTPL